MLDKFASFFDKGLEKVVDTPINFVLSLSKIDDFILSVANKLDGYGIAKPVTFSFFFFIFGILPWLFIPSLFFAFLSGLFYLTPVILPLLLLILFLEKWKKYKRLEFLSSKNPILLEIKFKDLPRAGPSAMELFFEAIHIAPGESPPINKIIKGATRPWWSFEMVSFEGELRFFIWTWDVFEDFLRTQLKAHFDELELERVPDYLDGLVADLNKIDLWGEDFRFTKSDAIPIKTYKVALMEGAQEDMLDNVFEKFSALGEGEFLILQIMAQVTTNTSWRREVESAIQDIYRKYGMKDESYPVPVLKPQDQTLVDILRSSTEKDAYDVGIRAVYIAKKDKFNPTRIGPNVVHMFRSFASQHLNYLLGASRWLSIFDYPWQDPFGKRQEVMKKKLIQLLKRRAYFHPPDSFYPYMVLTTEELASIYHFPRKAKYILKNKTSKSNNINEPPSNLPV